MVTLSPCITAGESVRVTLLLSVPPICTSVTVCQPETVKLSADGIETVSSDFE
jgi:hypothetical protein